MVKMEDPLQSHSSLPLLSKPNNMESFVSFISTLHLIMKQITRNPNVSRWRYIFSFGKKNNECVPMKATVVEANNKTYLIDRIETLEDRLIQLSLEIETRRTSRSATTTSTVRELPVSSYPVFNNPKPKCKRVSSDILPISTGCELQLLELIFASTIQRLEIWFELKGPMWLHAHNLPSQGVTE
ncbi:hypothetical protein CTI12_AA344730 [Artemisia annua]|uniref:Uncharacterized protein n=1 Tax=Artemisia annua TaxID=35608 RepID=A0A2U1MT45_ARTAN|nr:hypothetical protein CTI12_AA344730 [Artemisia annua]